MKRHKVKWEQMERYMLKLRFLISLPILTYECLKTQGCYVLSFCSNPLQGVCFKIREKSPRNGSFLQETTGCRAPKFGDLSAGITFQPWKSSIFVEKTHGRTKGRHQEPRWWICDLVLLMTGQPGWRTTWCRGYDLSFLESSAMMQQS